MGKLRKLQERYLKGELTKAQYEAECKKLLDDEILDQDAYDDALDYDPDYERPKYSQADVDSTVAKKAVKMVRKALKDAGVTVEADDKTLLSKVAETIKNGSSGKGDGEGGSGSSIDETELSNLKTKAAKVDDLTAQCKKLLIENAVLKEAGKYNPVNPAQVVRAISADYLDSIEFDEENGTADAKSIAALSVRYTTPNRTYLNQLGTTATTVTALVVLVMVSAVKVLAVLVALKTANWKQRKRKL